MSEPAVSQIRATANERRKLHAVRELVDRPKAKVKVMVGDDVIELPRSLVKLLLAGAEALEDGDMVAVVNEEDEVSPAQAAKLLGVSRQYVDRLIANDVLPAHRLPGSSYRRIPVRAVLEHRAAKERKREGIRSIVDAATDAGLDY